jgi:hypothetical protein
MTRVRRAMPAIGGVLMTVALVTGCGGGSSSSTSGGSTAAPTSSPSASSGRRFGGQNPAEFAKIRQCLQAAGISLPTPSPRPSATPGQPRPTRSPGQGGFGGGRGRFTDPKVQAALKACGITLPTPGSFRPPGSTASPAAQ